MASNEQGEFWVLQDDREVGGNAIVRREGGHREASEFKIPNGHIGAFETLNSGDLFMAYTSPGMIEIRDHETLVQKEVRLSEEIETHRGRSAYSKEFELFLPVGGQCESLILVNAATLEILANRSVESVIQDAVYLESEKRFVVFYVFGLIQEYSAVDFRLLSEYEIGEWVFRGDVSPDGRTIALRLEANGERAVGLFSR